MKCHFYSFFLLLLSVSITPIFSQVDCDTVSPIELIMEIVPDPASAPNIFPGDDFCLVFRAANFNSIEVFQVNIGFDPSILELIMDPNNPQVSAPLIGRAEVNANTTEADKGILPLIWQTTLGTAETLDDGDALMTVCFEAQNKPGECSDIISLLPNASSTSFSTFATATYPDGSRCEDIEVILNPAQDKVNIGCERLTVSDVDICQSSGLLCFKSCGGTFPVDWELETSGSITPSGTLTGINSKGNQSNLPSGVYNLKLVDADGARFDYPIIIDRSLNPILLNQSTFHPRCASSNDGSIAFQVTGGTGDYDVLFSTGVNYDVASGVAENLTNGTYDITVTDSDGCIEEFPGFQVFTPPLEVKSIQVDSFDCLFSTTGSLTICATGGTPINGSEYEYNNQVNDCFTQTDPMNQLFDFVESDTCYNVIIKDSRDCTIEECIKIPIRNSFGYTFDTIPPTCAEIGYTSEIVITDGKRYLISLYDDDNGGTIPSGGNNTFQIVNDLESGDYRWELLDLSGAGCMESFFFTIPPFSSDPLVLTPTSTQPDCGEENGTATITAMGGTGPYSYRWEYDPTQDVMTLTNLPSGQYSVTVTDSRGCRDETVVDLEQGVFLTIDAIIDTDLDCSDPTASAILEVAFTGFAESELNFNWYTEADAGLSNTPTLTTDTAGVYIVEVSTITGSCTITDTVTIQETSVLDYDFTFTDPAACDPLNPVQGRIEIFDIQGGSGTYICRWQLNGMNLPPVTNLDCVREDLGPGEYTITIIDNVTSCRAELILTLSSDDDVAFTHTFTNPDCPGRETGMITIGGIPGGPDLTCTWEDPTISALDCVASNLPAGDYGVNIKDENGCSKDTIITLVDPDLFIAEVSDSTGVSCIGDTDGTATVMVTSNPQNITDFIFLWNGNAGGMTGLSDTNMSLPSGPNTVTILDGNCDITLEFSIPEPLPIVLDNRDEVVMTGCVGECTGTITLQVSGGTGLSNNYTYTWVSDGVMSATRNDLCAGVQEVIIEDEAGCTIMDSIIVTEPDSLFLDIVEVRNLGCTDSGEGGYIELNARGGCDGYTYLWPNNESDTDRATELDEGDYTIIVTDGCGCTAEAMASIAGNSQIFAELFIDSEATCDGDRVCIGIDTTTIRGGTGTGYTFTVGGGALGPRISIDSCIMVLPGPQAISVFDSDGCQYDFGGLIEIPGPDPFTVDIGPDINSELGQGAIEITADIISSTDIVNVFWSPEEYDCLTEMPCDMISLTPTSSSIVSVVVTDENGCTAVDDLTIDLSTPRRVFRPTAFLPESSIDNKFMLLTGRGVEAISDFIIYDRWGNQVFELPEDAKPFPHSKDDGWDGRKDNQNCNSGVYVWIANVLFSDGEVIKYEGQVTLIR